MDKEMTFREILTDAGQSFVTWAVVGIGGGVLWLIRRVMTNQKQIEMLQKDLQAREEMRQRDREDVMEVKSDVKEMRSEIRQLFQNHGPSE